MQLIVTALSCSVRSGSGGTILRCSSGMAAAPTVIAREFKQGRPRVMFERNTDRMQQTLVQVEEEGFAQVEEGFAKRKRTQWILTEAYAWPNHFCARHRTVAGPSAGDGSRSSEASVSLLVGHSFGS